MDIQEIKRKAGNLHWKDLYGLLLLLVTFLPGKIWKLFSKEIWVVSEYEMMARDNGYWFYKYLREKKPEVTSYYPISTESPDYDKILHLGGAVKYGGIKHYCLFWASKYFCSSSSVQGFPYYRICKELVMQNLHGFKYIFLNHGITRGYSAIVNGSCTNYDLLCTCSYFDKRILVNENNQEEYKVAITGFARHDNLEIGQTPSNTILIMPTWRDWLSFNNGAFKSIGDNYKETFLKSEYYSRYSDLINNEDLIKLLEENDLTLIFYLHQYAQIYVDHFKSKSDRVVIGNNKTYDVQGLLKKASLLITDYSSVSYDFSYMHKPTIYYQFDAERFEKEQYAPGKLFSYENNGLGDMCFDEKQVVDLIKEYVDHSFEMKEQFRARTDDYFAYSDKRNCERIYQTIRKRWE